MDLEQRLKQLESYHDWTGVVEALEQGVLTSEDASKKADYHLRLGRLLGQYFLQGVRALKHFQDAYKLNPAFVGALSEARGIYWELGKLNMVQKLIELQLKNTQDPKFRGELLGELGDVVNDLGDYDRARDAYTKAGAEAAERLADVQVGAAEWQERIAALLRESQQTAGRVERGQLLLRAARIARRFAPTELEELLGKAYQADPANVNIAALFEGMLVEGQRTNEILERQKEAAKAAQDPAERGLLLRAFGARWALRHQNPELAAELLEESLRADPKSESAFTFIREYYGTKNGNWERVIRLADELSDRSGLGHDAGNLLALGGLIAWKERGDLILAKRFFQRLAQTEPQNPALSAFELQIGEKLSLSPGRGPSEAPRSNEVRRPVSEPPAALAPEPAPTPVAPPVEPAQITAEPPVVEAAPPVVSMPEPEPVRVVRAPSEPAPAAPPPVVAPVSVAPASAGEDSRLVTELRERLHQQESAKRYHEYVKTLLALGDAVRDPSEREELYAKAGDLYVNKFANQGEAVKAYEKVLEVNPGSATAVAYLREMYEKRRDWEKLIHL
ncbi:MAG TPA: hypothetical protein VFQ61_08895, partial [Polyangiaceae bacterium]|nr:hypothetical protein [Polyangiaceae bacterium]